MAKSTATTTPETTDIADFVPAEGVLSTMDFDALVASAANIAPWIGSGWTVVPTKEQSKLEGVPFVIVDIAERAGDFGPYYSLQVRLRNPIVIDGTETDRVVINDGSTGIYEQLSSMLDNGQAPQVPYFVSHGLNASHYKYKADDGTEKPATTFYLDAR